MEFLLARAGKLSAYYWLNTRFICLIKKGVHTHGGKNVKLYNERQVYLHPKFPSEFSPDVSVNILGIHKAWSSPTFYTKGSAHSLTSASCSFHFSVYFAGYSSTALMAGYQLGACTYTFNPLNNLMRWVQLLKPILHMWKRRHDLPKATSLKGQPSILTPEPVCDYCLCCCLEPPLSLKTGIIT